MRRVALIGTGLIGGSIGLALSRGGTEVLAFDAEPERALRAKELGVVSEVAATIGEAVDGVDAVIVAVPVGRVAEVVVAALDAGAPLVTDVGSVKASVVRAVEQARPDLAPRFVGGHPMAGSEQEGLDGADSELFHGATWVLTPTAATDPAAFGALRALVAGLGAEVVAVAPEQHDALVAVVSHVPQLAASTLMDVAAEQGEQHATLLRLAAGGFRDMTRIAASHPGIWPDICVANREAIVAALDEYVGALARVRALVDAGDRGGLLDVLQRARRARHNLPVGAAVGGPLVELRVPVPDRPGVLAEVTTLAGRLGVNIADLEIAHSMEGQAGVLVLVVAQAGADRFERGLTDVGYHVSRAAL
ncbi:MAG: prephenate dehydrogenase [Actinobacteria bacterium]|nr:prephenate dehydrogenase [Actinomycetota bacterium]